MIQKSKVPTIGMWAGLLLFITSCHSTNWNYRQGGAGIGTAPQKVRDFFATYPGHVLRMEALAPGYDYDLDIGEKDRAYGDPEGRLIFKTVEVRLHDRMPNGTVVTDFTFRDEDATVVEIRDVDLLRFIPRMDAQGDLRYAESILEELNRFGLSFRREHPLLGRL